MDELAATTFELRMRNNLAARVVVDQVSQALLCVVSTLAEFPAGSNVKFLEAGNTASCGWSPVTRYDFLKMALSVRLHLVLLDHEPKRFSGPFFVDPGFASS